MLKIWAVAKNTLAQAIRMKVAIIFIILLLILLPLMSVIMTGDGSLKGKLQTFISYGLGLTGFLLCILTIMVAGFTLSSDIKNSLLYTIITKPIKRYEIFLGKILGIVILDIILLVVFAATIYTLTFSIIKFTDASQADIAKVKSEFLTARAEINPVPPDLGAITDQIYEKAKAEERFKNMTQYQARQFIAKGVKLQSRSVPPGMRRIWQFENIVIEDPNSTLFVQYKYEVSTTPPDSMIIGYWAVGDIRPLKLGQPINPYKIARKDKVKTVHEIEINADAVAIDGHLDVVFENYYGNNTTVIFPQDTLKVLYRADSFTANYIRACLIILTRLIFFAALAISLSTWLSFPVVVSICLVVFFAGSISGFIIDSFGYTEGYGQIFSLIGSVVYLLPHFDGQYSPAEYMVQGQLISWSFLGYVTAMLVGLKAGLVSLLGIFVFNRREIAKITV